MSADDRPTPEPAAPLDDLAGSVLDGVSVEWELVETRATDEGRTASLRALRDLERIANYSRSLQRRLESPPKEWGHLTILELASSGSSGEIWRAWDSSLQREVAIKFLYQSGEGGPEGSTLLEEARALARVRHPGVVNVYGIGDHAGRIGMWMELLRGESLEAEIERRGALSPAEVAEIGLALCRALEAVGAAGLVHRDIKPANIVRESDGRIVLTDFGLGRRRAIPDREAWRSSGTPVFMAPERLAGEPATPRSDLYALGVTLRWALTGRCPFRARTIEELKTEAEAGPAHTLRQERPEAPPGLIEAIDRAMSPRAEDRHAGPAQMAERLAEFRDRAQPRAAGRVLWVVAFLAVAVSLAVTANYWVSRLSNGPTALQQPVRFSVTAPRGTIIPDDRVDQAVSPDGTFLVFGAMDSAGVHRLWLRPLDSLESRPLEGTADGARPFWSPDSRSIAFFAGMKLQKISVTGGPPETLCRAPDGRGGTWGRDGVIVFAPEVTGSLWSVSAEGGTVTEIQRPDSSRQETALRWPQFLPDGKRFFFVSLPPRDGGFDVFVASLGSKERRRVMTAGCAPIPAGKDAIILASNGRLLLQRFDYRSLKPVGTAVALGPAPFCDVSVGEPLATASRNGVLAHLDAPLTNTRLTWLDREGRAQGELALTEGRYESFHFSPDGKKLLAARRDSPTTVDLWLIALDRGEARRFSQGSQTRLGGKPVWSPDGKEIAFNSNRSGRTYIYTRSVSEAGAEKPLYQSPGQFNEVLAWSPDGRYLVFQQASPETGWDLWLLPLTGKRQPIPYLQSRFNEYAASVSPDGHWLAYTTEMNGKPEVFVRSFPTPGVEHLASELPGQAVWSANGRELLVSTWQGFWSVPISTVPAIRAGKPHLLFHRHADTVWMMATPSGDRFLESRPTIAEQSNVAVDLNIKVPGSP